MNTGKNVSTYVIKEGQRKLEAAGKESSAFDARALLSFVTGIPFRDMPLHYADEVTMEQQALYEHLLERRIGGEPLQYITGEQEFMGLPFHVDPRVLIPRLDTEILAEEAVGFVNEILYGDEPGLYNDQNPDRSGNECHSNEHKEFRILDLCCGSGAIGLSVAVLADGRKDGSQISDEAGAAAHAGVEAGDEQSEKNRNVSSALVVTLSDISEDALDVARQNAEALGVMDRVGFVRSDLFEAFSERSTAECRGAGVGGAGDGIAGADDAGDGIAGAGKAGDGAAVNVRGDFDLIVCNPPYIRSDVIPTLDEEVRGHEPVLALDGGPDGLDIYRRIAEEAPAYLKPGGCLMMEIGFDQGDAVAELLRQSFYNIGVRKDLAGFDRVITAKI